MLRTSLVPDDLLYDTTQGIIPPRITLANFQKLIFTTDFLMFVKNSLVVTLASTAVSLVISVFTSYCLARLRFPGRIFYSRSIMISYLLPSAVLFIPMYILVSRIGLANNKWGLVVIYPTFIVPYCCYMLTSYFRAIPYALEEASSIDGCTRIQTIIKIVLPIAAPGIAVVATFSFTMSWNEFLYALVVTTSPSQLTAIVGINSFKFADSFLWGLLMSSSVIASVPAIILYLFTQSRLMGQWSQGGVKG
ncbi:MAG: carbohydrate ABC transporter permease [Treponema sp.]|nr:carbohydrate ABC transporter permease [Treponema sp.]